jgi:hypothetical protein
LGLCAEDLVEARRTPDPAWLAQQQMFVDQYREAPRASGWWKASLVALAAGSALDIHSSLGKRELNPLLAGANGQFGAKGIAIKSAITGGAVLGQWLFARKNQRHAKIATVANFGMAGLLMGAAKINYGHTRPPAFSSVQK